MSDTIDERVSVLEEFYTDLPEMLNLRFERINGSLSEINVRLNLQDKQLATLTRDVRDMRAGVTRQLIAQDQRLSVQDAMLASHDSRLSAIETRLGAIEKHLAAHDGLFGAIEKHLTAHDESFEGIKADIEGVKTNIEGVKVDIKGVNDKLDLILRALQTKG